MTPPNNDADQQPALVVTQGVADLVDQEFDLFKPQLEQTIGRWRKEKARVMGKSQTHIEDSDEQD